ncbi:hypothetical protein GUJ93_ZPchr0011g27606 [Zizania palustris]|uniref:Uncharacterized protein n=1 Tax=Zizania palustris TaxID=103762 RepID=A0A8J6BUN8_ZIZPA|nr:hypothetical protein GUJ93_ZPchr0011g27606 [Zizania palustris]
MHAPDCYRGCCRFWFLASRSRGEIKIAVGNCRATVAKTPSIKRPIVVKNQIKILYFAKNRKEMFSDQKENL